MTRFSITLQGRQLALWGLAVLLGAAVAERGFWVLVFAR